MPEGTKKARSAKTPEPADSTLAERLTVTLFEADSAAIKRLRNGIFADTEEIATASEILRYLLREAPKTLDSKRFLAVRAQMQQEDGRSKRAAAAK
jgi:hypothetical protein